MKTALILAALITITTLHAQTGAEAIAKQRAREVVNQSNVRQGVNAPPAPPPPPSAAAKPGQPAPADPVTKLKVDVAAILDKPAVTPALKEQFTRDLLAASRGSHKPSAAALEKFATSFCAALAGQPLDTPAQTRLVQDINLALNSTSLSPQRTTEVTDDAQAILQTAGLTRGAAVVVVNDLKAITAELQSAGAK